MSDTEVKATKAKVEQGKQAKARTMTDILAAKKPNTRTVDIILDSDLAGEISMKRLEIEQTKQRSKGRKSLAEGTQTLEQELDDLIDSAAEIAVTFTFTDIGRKNFDDLVHAHQPTEEQRKQIADLGGGILEYNTETFPPALISAAASDPEITVEEAQEIFDEWGQGDAETLFSVALIVCKERTSVPLSKNGTDPISSFS